MPTPYDSLLSYRRTIVRRYKEILTCYESFKQWWRVSNHYYSGCVLSNLGHFNNLTGARNVVKTNEGFLDNWCFNFLTIISLLTVTFSKYSALFRNIYTVQSLKKLSLIKSSLQFTQNQDKFSLLSQNTPNSRSP